MQALGLATTAHLVAVISTGNVLWCASRTEADVDTYADDFYRASIAPRRVDLKRGARFDVVQRADDEVQVARSFAAIYVLVLWFKLKPTAIVASRFVLQGFDETSACRLPIWSLRRAMERRALERAAPDEPPVNEADRRRDENHPRVERHVLAR